jgi:hypothetical protein
MISKIERVTELLGLLGLANCIPFVTDKTSTLQPFKSIANHIQKTDLLVRDKLELVPNEAGSIERVAVSKGLD